MVNDWRSWQRWMALNTQGQLALIRCRDLDLIPWPRYSTPFGVVPFRRFLPRAAHGAIHFQPHSGLDLRVFPVVVSIHIKLSLFPALNARQNTARGIAPPAPPAGGFGGQARVQWPATHNLCINSRKTTKQNPEVGSRNF